MQTFDLRIDDETLQMTLALSHYTNVPFNRAVMLVCFSPFGWEPYAVLSINTEHHMADNEFILNHDIPQSVAEAMEQLGLIQKTGQTRSYGFVENQPVYILCEKAKEFTSED